MMLTAERMRATVDASDLPRAAMKRRDERRRIFPIGWRTMFRRIHAAVALTIVTGMLPAMSAQADMYVWTDKAGVTNVSNLPPPEGTRLQRVTYAAPKDAAQEAAFREAARQAEIRALNERVQELQAAVEQARREPPPPTIVVTQAPAPPPAPQVIVVSPPAPAYPQPVAAGCDFSWPYNCGFGFWPGFYPATVVLGDNHFRHRHHHRPGHQARPRHSLRTPPGIFPIVPVPRQGHWRH
jgi:hypothetical protein